MARPTETKLIAEEETRALRLRAAGAVRGRDRACRDRGEVAARGAESAPSTQAYADVRDNEVWLVGAEILEYAQGNIANHGPPGTKSCC